MFKSLLLTLIAFSNLGLAGTDTIVNQDLIYQQIIENEPDAIFFSTEDKIYLRHEKVRVSSRGIFVGNVPISAMFSDSTGCWMQKPENYWICSNDKCYYYKGAFRSETGLCPACNKPGKRG